MAHGNPYAEVIGLDQFPEDEIPPLYIHYLFDIMVTIGMWMVFLSGVFWLGDQTTVGKWFRQNGSAGLSYLVVRLSLFAIEAGWWLAEVGRQPWVLRGIMRTQDAATTSDHVDMMLILFACFILFLGLEVLLYLRRMFRNNPVEREIEDRDTEKGGDVL